MDLHKPIVHEHYFAPVADFVLNCQPDSISEDKGKDLEDFFIRAELEKKGKILLFQFASQMRLINIRANHFLQAMRIGRLTSQG